MVLGLLKSGVLNLFLLAYPQIKMNPLRVPPNQNWPLCVPPKLLLFPFYWAYFDMSYISEYPLRTACIPPGVRVPQVENRWLKSLSPITVCRLAKQYYVKWFETNKQSDKIIFLKIVQRFTFVPICHWGQCCKSFGTSDGFQNIFCRFFLLLRRQHSLLLWSK
jgi:hypothetical protein